jgi:hypothetical protein
MLVKKKKDLQVKGSKRMYQKMNATYPIKHFMRTCV